ncbi:MAG TPA: DUF4278 domain-containing protein [Coleofasciculaceae cyanobacterium]
MKLIYRGLTYDYDPAKGATRYPFQRTRTSQSTYELIYRGNRYRVEPNAITKTSVQPVTYELIYRGVTYWLHRKEQGGVIAIAPIYKPFKKIRLKAILSRLISD